MTAREHSVEGLKWRIGGRFGDDATLGTNMKERRITRINLSSEKNETSYYSEDGWGAGNDGSPLNCWRYHANFNGLHVDKLEGGCCLVFTLFYNE